MAPSSLEPAILVIVFGIPPGGDDEFSKRVQDDIADMPERMFSLLSRFLERNGSVLSQRAGKREFEQLSADEVEQVEKLYAQCFPR